MRSRGLDMALSKHKLGEFLLPYDCRNKDLSIHLFQGISTNKVFTNPKQVAEDISSTKIVRKGQFANNKATTRNGEKISVAYRYGEDCAVSSAYQVFYIKEGSPLLPEYLLMFFRRPEFDRYVRCNSWGSAHEFFTFEDMCDVEIELPDLTTQQKYVDIYNAMVANQQCYERGLEDLKLVCDGYIEDLRKKIPCEKIGQYLIESNKKNDIGLTLESVRGLSTNKAMIPTKAEMNGVGLDGYKVVSPRQIAYVPDTSRRGEKVSLGFNNTSEQFLVSSIYTVFGTKIEVLLPEYLMLFFTRTEFDRYARFNSWGSARETFEWNEMCNLQIPIPDIKVQQAIVDVFIVYTQRQELNEKLKAQIKNICPILVRGSLEESK